MGACYDVRLKVKLEDENAAILVLNKHIGNDVRTDYSLSQYSEQGVITETYNGLMRIFLADRKGQELKIREEDGGFVAYENSFNASYGWKSVLVEMFEKLSSYLEDGSFILIYADNDYDELVVRNGTCVQMH